MPNVYVAKASTTETSPFPVNWPIHHPIPPWPNPIWPPGWPMDDEETYYFNVTMDDYLGHSEGVDPENQETITLDIFDDSQKIFASDGLEYHIVTVTCVDGDGEVVQLTKTDDEEGPQDTLSYQITNYAGANYGFTDDITFDLGAGDISDILTLTFTIASISPEQNTTDTIVVVAPH